MTHHDRCTLAASAVATLALLLGADQAEARWTFSVNPYAWATDIGVDATLDGRTVVDAEIPVSDLMEDLSTIFMVKLEARNGAFGVALDVFDVTLADEKDAVALPGGGDTADFSSDAGMTILDVAGVFDPRGDGHGIALLYGGRMLNQRATIDATLMLASGDAQSLTYDTSDWLVDGLLGIRFVRPLTRRWSATMQAEISAGGTDYTWSVGPTISYAFGHMSRYAVNAGYRRMVIDYEDANGLDASMTLSGLNLGFRVSF